MKDLRHDLFWQLISIGVIIFGVILVSLGLILPRVLLPIYEQNVYNFLKHPLEMVDFHIEENEYLDEIAYLYIVEDTVIISENYHHLIEISPNEIVNKIDQEHGKILYQNSAYYYYTTQDEDVLKVALTDDRYVNLIQRDVVATILPVLLLTFLIVVALVISWSRRLVLKIYYLKNKVANINRDDFFELYHDNHHLDDELNALSKAIDEMHITLKKQEDYKSQMYQNISHDFKTPLMVIKSYIEAIEDNVLSKEEGLQIIQEQINKLENKVHSLLYLNKLNYLQEVNNYQEIDVEIVAILKETMEKFRYENTDLKWELKARDEEIFKGTFDMWEAIIDNMLHNFVRYADKKIKITVRKNEIIFFNDGPNIDETILHDLFTPYKKGMKGKFGLGLSIIKKSLHIMGYEITVNNERKGVTFKIFPKND